MANDYDRLIETVDEEGNIVKFELIDIVLVGEDEYGILIPADAQKDDNEAVIMKLKKVDEDFIFEYIDDDAEFQKVVDAIDALEDDEDDEDFDDQE